MPQLSVVVKMGLIDRLRSSHGKDDEQNGAAKVSNLQGANTGPNKIPIGKFAKELDATVEILTGACNPSKDSPYLQLDHHHWEAFKKNTPSRGPNSVPSVVVAATLLCLWARHEKITAPTLSLATSVLSTIGAEDKNPGRGIKNCQWLQERNGAVILNPAQVSNAIELVKKYLNSLL
jgi:hypothetical protein